MLLQMPSNHILIINIIEQENIDDSYNKMFTVYRSHRNLPT